MPYVFKLKIYNVHTSCAIWTATLTKAISEQNDCLFVPMAAGMDDR
jgi:hypothetical protein